MEPPYQSVSFWQSSTGECWCKKGSWHTKSFIWKEERLLARSERQALHKLRRSRLKRPSFMQEVSSPERSTFVQFTYSDFCHNFSNVATAWNLNNIVLWLFFSANLCLMFESTYSSIPTIRCLRLKWVRAELMDALKILQVSSRKPPHVDLPIWYRARLLEWQWQWPPRFICSTIAPASVFWRKFNVP